MSLAEKRKNAEERMVQISKWIDEENEAARLQGGALAGALVGGWMVAFAIETGIEPIIVVSLLTLGVVGGIAAHILL